MDALSPWREPMVWLVVALPLGSILASALLIAAALRSGGDDPVADRVRRTAQIQVSELGPDLQARQRQLSAVLRLGPAGIEVLPAHGEFDRNAMLALVLRHPTRAADDVHLELSPRTQGWGLSGERAGRLSARHDWKLELSDPAGGWRLQGRLPAGQRAAHLGPVLASP